MSYARWGEDGSDVYVYGASSSLYGADDYLICMHLDGEGSFTCKTPGEMIAHLREHEARGDTVPARAFERLEKEGKDARA